MRPIDAEKLIQNLNMNFDDYAVYSDVFDVIDDAPTLDVAPVVSAHWINVKDRLPDREDLFLIYHQKYGMNIARFDYYRSKKFLISDERIDGDYGASAEYWAELPDPPESVQD